MSAQRDQDGGIVTGWLLRLVATMAVLALVVFEVGALVVASVDADSAAGEIARAATVAYRSSGSVTEAQSSGQAVADERSVELVSLDEDGGGLVVEVERIAGTLLLHRFGITEDLTRRTGTRRVEIET
ncbi:MAG: hypothetical protein R6V28_04865 [Nitriliruptoraceae bacterium]